METARQTDRTSRRKLISFLSGDVKRLYRQGLRKAEIASATGLSQRAVAAICERSKLSFKTRPSKRLNGKLSKLPIIDWWLFGTPIPVISQHTGVSLPVLRAHIKHKTGISEIPDLVPVGTITSKPWKRVDPAVQSRILNLRAGREVIRKKRYLRPDVDNQDLLNDWSKGMGYHDLAKKYKISYRTVYKRLREARAMAGNPTRELGYCFVSADQKRVILRAKGQPVGEVAAQAGVSASTVRRITVVYSRTTVPYLKNFSKKPKYGLTRTKA